MKPLYYISQASNQPIANLVAAIAVPANTDGESAVSDKVPSF